MQQQSGEKQGLMKKLKIFHKRQTGQKKTSKNREFAVITYSFLGLFLCLMGYFAYFEQVKSEQFINNPYNKRQELFEQNVIRGEIYSADGVALAQTLTDEAGNETRKYPAGRIFAHVVGYSTHGRTGIEALANFSLLRSNIFYMEKAVSDLQGEKSPGDNVTTTLNYELQLRAFDALGSYDGAVVVIEPETGKILAMVSKPDFDPNRIAAEWEDILADEENGTLLNRTTQGLYPPGSTFKIVTALEYIRENPDTYASYCYTCGGSLREGDDVINCYHGSKHGQVSLQTSFAKSCNTSFANMGMGFDRVMFADTLHSLLFNQELPLSCVYNQSRLEIQPDDSNGEMMQNAIGQGRTQITPVHLAMITASVANGGVLMKPYLIRHVESADGTIVKEFSPEPYGALMTAQEADILAGYMKAVVESGTGTKLSGLSYTAAGKTGSAEFNSQKGESHAWFTGFAPAEDPQIVVTVIIEGAGSGGDYAVPMARRVFDACLKEAE